MLIYICIISEFFFNLLIVIFYGNGVIIKVFFVLNAHKI